MPSFTEELAPCPICLSRPGQHHYLLRSRVNRPNWPGSPYCRLQICKRCGFVFISPRLNKAGYESFYQDGNYAELADDGETNSMAVQKRQNKSRTIRDFISGALPPNPDAAVKVLDLGCGFGDTLAAFQEKYHCDVLGVEISTTASDYAKTAYGIEVIRENLEECPDINSSFDVVICSAVLEHLCDPRSFARYIRSLAKDEGVIFISVPDLKSIDFRLLKGHLVNKIFKPVHTCYFDEGSLGLLLKSAGLEVISQRKVWAYAGAPQAELWVLAKPDPKSDQSLPSSPSNWRRTAFYVWKKSALVWMWSETVNVMQSLLGKKITSGIYKMAFKRRQA